MFDRIMSYFHGLLRLVQKIISLWPGNGKFEITDDDISKIEQSVGDIHGAVDDITK